MKLKYLFLLPALLISLLSFSQTSSNALNFDNTNDHVVVSPTIAYTSTFTLEAWVNFSGTSATIFGWGNNTTNGYVNFAVQNSRIRLAIGNGATFTLNQFNGNTILSSNTWYHVAAVKSGPSITMYLNGVQDGTFTSTNTPALVTSSIIGAGLFNGIVQEFNEKSIDEVRIWNVARSASEISNNYNCPIAPQAGLVAYYQFNQGTPSGNNAGISNLNDNSGNLRNGTLINFSLNGPTSNWVVSEAVAPTLNYRTISSGVWNNPTIWETEIGSCWVPAINPPIFSSEIITIRNGHNVSINNAIIANQLIIESGASLAVVSVGRLEILDAPGVDLIVNGTLSVSSGDFVVFSDAVASIESSASLDFTQGNIGGEGTILVKSGGTFNNLGTGNKNYNGATNIINQGSFNWNAAAGNIFFDGGNVTLNSYNTIEFSANGQFSNNGNTASTFTINNGGTITKSTSGLTDLGNGVTITNDGNISITQGRLSFDNVVFFNNAVINWSPLTLLEISNSTVEFNTATAFTGNANLKLSSSSVLINTLVSFPIGGSLDFNSGLLNGNGTLRMLNSSLLTWNGGTFGGNLTTEIQGLATLSILGSVAISQQHTIQNFGTIDWVGNGNIDFLGDETNATITNLNNFNFSSTGSIVYSSGEVGTLTINNISPGVITKSNGSTEIHPRVNFYNEIGSQLTISSGTLDVRSTVSLFSGNIQVSNSGSLIGDQPIVFGGQIFGNSGLVNFPDVTFQGEVQQTINGLDGGTFNNLSINNPSDVQFDTDFSVSESLEFNNGKLRTIANKVSTTIFTEIIGGSQNSYLIGALDRGFDINSTQFYPIGSPIGFAPLTIQANSPSEGLVVIASALPGDHPDAANAPVSATKSVNTFWNVNTSGGYGSLNISFGYEPFLLDEGANEAAFNVGQLNGEGWQSLVPSNISQGLITVENITSPQDFFIGEGFFSSQGSALNFSGPDNYILGPVELIPNNNNPYTVSVWARANEVIPGTSADILSQGREFSIGYNTLGNFRIGDSWETGTPFPTDGLWHNYAVVRGFNSTALFIDGINVTSTDYAIPAPGPTIGDENAEFIIGAKWPGPSIENWQGDIDEVLVYNRMLCDEEISSRYNCEQSFGLIGLIAAYNFNQGDVLGDNFGVTTLLDASENGNSATLINFTLTGPNSNWIGTGGVVTGLSCSGIEPVLVYRDEDGDGFGNLNNSMLSNSICGTPFGYTNNSNDCNDADFSINPLALETCDGIDQNCSGTEDENNALDFDGVDDFVTIPDFNIGTNPFTIEFWTRANALPAQEAYLIANRSTELGSAGNWYRISIDPSGYIGVEFGLAEQPTGLFMNSISQVQPNNWYHIALTRDSENIIKLYVNGLEESTASDVARDFISITESVTLGAWPEYNLKHFNGAIDELRYWNTARTRNEIRANQVANLSDAPNLAANYTFNQGIANGENAAVTTLIENNFIQYGVLNNFALSSSVAGSNWVGSYNTNIYADFDGDGFGDPTTMLEVNSPCNKPQNYISFGGDCNDENPNANPEATEITNGIDDNCNGQIDENVTCNVSLTGATGDSLIVCLETNEITGNVQLVVTGGSAPYIFSGSDTLNLTAGVYNYQVVDANGCEASASVEVIVTNCIIPYYQPPTNDTISNLIGSELTQLFFFPETFADSTTANEIFSISEIEGQVLIEVISNVGQTETLFALLQTSEYGLNNIIDNGDSTLIITGFFPIANLTKLDSLPELINYVRPYYSPINGNFPATGLTTTQGDLAIGGVNAKTGWQISGEGVKVGILSDSYNTKAGNPASLDVTNGDLPGLNNPNYTLPVNVTLDYPYGRASDEGRAMLQIVHDIAPNAELYFRTGFISAGNFAEGIKELADSGCSILVDDITYITEPFFQDGVISKAVEEVSAQGVSYITSAGNFGSRSYEGIFNPTTAPAGYTGEAHNFGGGDVYQSISLEQGTYTIAMQWEDDFYSLEQNNGAQNDLDIYLVDQFGNRLFGFNRNNITGDPLEILPFVVRSNVNANLIVTRKSGTANVRFKYIIFRGSINFNEYAQGTSTIVAQANAASAMSVGAVLFSNTPAYGVNPPTVASFSSRGGVAIDGVDRNKPDFCGPNGINTTVSLGGVNIDGDAFPNFFGTSAAAPHIAGAAALIQEAKLKFQNQNITGAQMKALLKDNAIDMETPGFDNATGAGFIQVDATLNSFSNPLPSIASIELQDSSLTSGQQPINVIIHGNNFDEEASIIFQYDTLDVEFLSDTQLVAQIPVFDGNPPLTVFNPALTNSGFDGGLSDSLYFFGTIPQNIRVVVNSATKLFGEIIPAYEIEVSVNGTPLASTGLNLIELGLDDLTFYSSANTFSNVGLYFRRANSSVTDLSLPESQTLAELYNYQFIDGVLTIERMPVTVTPKDTTLEYGEAIDGKAIQFQYDFITENINPTELTIFLDSLKATHQSTMSSTVIVAEGKTIAEGRSLTAADLENLSFFASGKVEANSVSAGSGRRIVNGVEFDTTNYVSLAPESIFDLETDEVNLTIYNALSAGSGRRIVNTSTLGSGRRIVNALAAGSGRRIVNGESLVNGTPIVNGLSTGSGRRIVNSNTFNENSNEGAILLLDSLDAVDDNSAPDSISGYTSMNLITGVSVGEWVIAPGALISDNFDISYGVGKLNITPMQLFVRAEDKVKGCTDSTIEFTSVKEFYQYEFVDSTVLASGPDYTILNQSGAEVSIDSLTPGTYQIVLSNLAQIDSIPNYIPVYEPGQLIVEEGVTAQANAGTITCFGRTTTVEVTASGGTAPYSGIGTFTVSAGDYNFTVTDAIGCSSTVSGNITQPASLPAQPTGLACWQSANFNETTCSWDVTGTQPSQPTGLACWQSAAFNDSTCIWDVTGTQPSQPTGLACWQNAAFNTTSCSWDVTGTQPAQPTGLACWQNAAFNDSTCIWDVTGTQPSQPTGLACWQNAAFNDSTCIWDVTGTQPSQPTGLACWQSANFNTTSCSWDVTGTQPAQPTQLACWENASFDTVNCGWVITGTQPAQPTQLACWQNANFNTSTCSWDVTGTQPVQPTQLACWENASFDTVNCGWVITGTQPTQPTGLACWQNANFNTSTCSWDVTGTQPAQPTGLACWQSAAFNDSTCIWDVTGTQPSQPTGLACWQNAAFNTTSCSWDVTGTQPAQPTQLACWENASFDTVNCGWVITGTQPAQPSGLACWQNANFNTSSCTWDVTGTQPAQPTGLACWQNAAFNTTSCSWDVRGTQPAQPTQLACWQNANFNTSTCSWDVTGTQPVQPTQLACWESANFNTTSCSWDVTGTQPVLPTGLACWQNAAFNDSTCIWDVTGTQPVQPTGLACWQTVTFNNSTCAWVVTGTQAPAIIINVTTCNPFTWSINNQVYSLTGTYNFTLNCQAYRLNLVVTPPVNVTGTIAGPTNACPHQGTTGTIATYTVQASNASSFVWTIPSGSTNITGQGTASISFRFPSTFNSGSVGVTVGGCGASIQRSLTVTKSAPTTPVAISGPTNLCAFRGTNTQVNYSIASVANASSYTWTIPSGITLVSGTGTTSIQVLVGSSFSGGILKVRANSTCGNSSTRDLSLNVSTPSTPASITGTSKTCPGEVVVYSVASVSNATSYLWSVPSGTTIVSGLGTNTISLSFGNSFNSGTLSVRAVNGCGQSSTRSITLSRNTPATPASISGPASNLCGGGIFNYTVSPVAGATSYIWTVPTGCSITANNGTNITVSFPSNFSSGSITAKAVNSCGSGTATSLSLSRLPSTPSSISGPTTFCRNQQNVVYTTPMVEGQTYTWTVPSGAIISSGQGTASIIVKFGTSNGNVTVKASNSCGISSTRSLAVCAVSCRMGQEVPDGSEPIELVNEMEPIVYPNPGNGQFTIVGINQKSVIQVYNAIGQLVRNEVVQSDIETLQINLNSEANGLYLIRIENANGMKELSYIKQ